MRVLLDECVPRQLRRDLPEHEILTVVEAGWGGTKNGALLRRAAGKFDVLLTVDTNMEHQQNITALPVAIVVLVAFSNDVDVLHPLMPRLRKLLPMVKPGHVYRVGPA